MLFSVKLVETWIWLSWALWANLPISTSILQSAARCGNSITRGKTPSCTRSVCHISKNSQHKMTSSNGNIFALLALCARSSPVTGDFLSQRPVTRSFDVFFHLCLNQRLSKQSWGWWFETPSRTLWRHCNESPALNLYHIYSPRTYFVHSIKVSNKRYPSFHITPLYWFNLFWPGGAIWRYRSVSTMAQTSNGSWCMGIKGEMSGTVCVTFTWDMYIWVVYRFCLFCCLYIIAIWWYAWCIVWASGRVGVNSIPELELQLNSNSNSGIGIRIEIGGIENGIGIENSGIGIENRNWIFCNCYHSIY